jgi:regulator of cell morphogenesis and NO signaling
MSENTLATALEREHREIDGGLEEYSAALATGNADPAPLQRSLGGLRRHIYLEEQFLFPPLSAAGMMMPIMVMLREHGELWRAMAAIDALLAEKADADTVLGACRDLLSLLDKHNSKEEPIIYPRAGEGLSAETGAELGAFIDGGQMPEDWVCEGARA